MALLMVLLVLKIAYAVASPLSLDFIAYVNAGRLTVEGSKQFFGVYTVPSYLYAAFYKLWLLLPIEHPDSRTLLSDRPQEGLVVAYFEQSLGAWIFVAVMKLPLLIFDFLATFLIYRLASTISSSKRTALIAAVVWQANPFFAILEMYNAIDISTTVFLLLLLYLGLTQRPKPAAYVVWLGGLVRAVPALFVPYLTIYFAKAGRRAAVSFLTIFLAATIGTFAAILIVLGPQSLASLLGPEAGISMGEIRGFLGPLLEPQAKSVAAAIGLNLVFYVGFLWFSAAKLDRRNLSFVMYAPLLFFLAFSFVSPAFLLWAAPYFTLRAVLDKDSLSLTAFSSVGAVWLILAAPDFLSGFGTGLFFVPVWNESASNLSAYLTSLQGGLNLPKQFARSGLAAVLVSRIVEGIYGWRNGSSS